MRDPYPENLCSCVRTCVCVSVCVLVALHTGSKSCDNTNKKQEARSKCQDDVDLCLFRVLNNEEN